MPRREEPGIVLIENAELTWLNFTGRKEQYNDKGERQFSVFIDDRRVAEAMARDGWNIKETNPREDGDEPRAYVQVTARYDILPPKVYMITSRGKTFLPEEMLPLLDSADIKVADLTIRPRVWTEDRSKPWIKAYLKSLFITVEEDYLDRKYAEIPDAKPNSTPASDEPED